MGTKRCAWGKAALKSGEKEHICHVPPGELADASKLLHGLGRWKVDASNQSPGLRHGLNQRQKTLRNLVCAGGTSLGLGKGKWMSSCRPPAGAREPSEAPIRHLGMVLGSGFAERGAGAGLARAAWCLLGSQAPGFARPSCRARLCQHHEQLCPASCSLWLTPQILESTRIRVKNPQGWARCCGFQPRAVTNIKLISRKSAPC